MLDMKPKPRRKKEAEKPSDVVDVVFQEDGVHFTCSLDKVKNGERVAVGKTHKVKWLDGKCYEAKVLQVRRGVSVSFMAPPVDYYGKAPGTWDTPPDPNDFKVPHYNPNTDPYFHIGMKMNCQRENDGAISCDIKKERENFVATFKKNDAKSTLKRRCASMCASAASEECLPAAAVGKPSSASSAKCPATSLSAWLSSPRLPFVKDIEQDKTKLKDPKRPLRTILSPKREKSQWRKRARTEFDTKRQLLRNGTLDSFVTRLPVVKLDLLPDAALVNNQIQLSPVLNSVKKQSKTQVSNRVDGQLQDCSPQTEAKLKSLSNALVNVEKNSTIRVLFGDNEHNSVKKQKGLPLEDNIAGVSSATMFAHASVIVDQLKAETYLERWRSVLPARKRTSREPMEAADRCRASFQIFLEDKDWLSAIYEVTHVTSWSYYPSPSTVQDLIVQMIMDAPSVPVVYAASDALMEILELHPPINSSMRQFYLKVLSMNEVSHPWLFIEKIVRDCIALTFNFDLSTLHEKHFISRISLIMFFCKLFELDFACFVTSSQNPAEDLTFANRRPLFVQLLWGTDNPKTVTHNCLNLLKLCIRGVAHNCTHKVQTAVQKLVFYLLEYCRLSETNTGTSAKNPGTTGFKVAESLAATMMHEKLNEIQIGSVLNSLDLPWATLIVSELLLDVMGDSELPTNNSPEVSSTFLHKIVTQFMSLVPFSSDSEKSGATIDFVPFSLPVSTNVLVTPVKSIRRHGGSCSTPISPRLSVTKRNCKGETSLHLACIRNNIERVRQLLSVPGIDVNARDNCGWTPLHEACNRGNLECVLELLKFKPLKTINSYFSKGQTTKQGIDVTVKAFNNITPLHDAASGNHIEIAGALLKFGGAKLLEARNSDGETPLDVAASTEMKVLLKDVLSRQNRSLINNCSSSPTLNHNERSFKGSNLVRYIVLVRHFLVAYLDVRNIREIWSHVASGDSASTKDTDSHLTEVKRLRIDLQAYSEIYCYLKKFEEHILKDCQEMVTDLVWLNISSLHLLVMPASHFWS